MVKFIICIFLIIFIIWYIPIYQTNTIAIKSLHGFYNGDNSFMEEAGLSSLILYLDNNIGHIYLEKNNGEILLNDSFNWTIQSNITENLNSDINNKRIYTIKFKGIDCDAFPTSQIIEFYPLVGKIIMRQKKIVFAVCYKDNQASEVKNLI
jgi:hypothetical protein